MTSAAPNSPFPERRVAVDSSPLIGLAAAGELERLPQLFAAVIVTRAVRDEVLAGSGRPGARELEAALRAGWIRVAPTPMETWRFPELGVGEASTLAFALASGPGTLVLMDDLEGRAQARALGIEVIDLPCVLLAAKRAGLLASVGTALRRLAASGHVVAEDRRRVALDAADESE